MTLDIAVLVSAGRHPVSGRPRRAPGDAQALEAGLTLAAAHDADLRVLHAGDANEPALRDYLGMGIEALHVIALPPEADPIAALIEPLRAMRPALVLTGMQAETGWSSGCVPYALAAAVGYSVVPAAASLVLDGGSIAIEQALPRGRRRALRVALPAIVTVSSAAPPARQVAFVRVRRGRLVVEPPLETLLAAPPSEQVETRPARPRPRRLTTAKHAAAAERLRALTTGPQRSAKVVRPSTPAEAAREILDFLEARGLHEASYANEAREGFQAQDERHF